MCAEMWTDQTTPQASLTHSLTRGQSVSAAPALLCRLLCVSMWRGGTHLLGDDVAGRSNARALLHRHGGSGHESHHLGREQAERHGKMRLRTTEDKERKGRSRPRLILVQLLEFGTNAAKGPSPARRRLWPRQSILYPDRSFTRAMGIKYGLVILEFSRPVRLLELYNL